jgi:hypothetical protein
MEQCMRERLAAGLGAFQQASQPVDDRTMTDEIAESRRSSRHGDLL